MQGYPRRMKLWKYNDSKIKLSLSKKETSLRLQGFLNIRKQRVFIFCKVVSEVSSFVGYQVCDLEYNVIDLIT